VGVCHCAVLSAVTTPSLPCPDRPYCPRRAIVRGEVSAVPELSIPEAADALRLSIVSAFHRRTGERPTPGLTRSAGAQVAAVDPEPEAPQAEDDRPEAEATVEAVEEISPIPGALEVELLRAEVAHAREVIAEVNRSREILEQQLQAQMRQMERAEEERHELRILLSTAMQSMPRELPAPATERRAHWWRRG
jgi:hypothetical protein